MGPRFFKRGEFDLWIESDSLIKLQWGHASSSVESRPARGWGIATGRFNGATLLQAWRVSGIEIVDQMTEVLQWGHASSSVESRARAAFDNLCGNASMGPRFFKRGEHLSVLSEALNEVASMGPRFFKRGELRVSSSPVTHAEMLQWGHASSSVERKS